MKECVKVLKEHFSTVTSLTFSEVGCTMLSAGRDNVWFKFVICFVGF